MEGGGVTGAINNLIDDIKTNYLDLNIKNYDKDNYVSNSKEFKPINPTE